MTAAREQARAALHSSESAEWYTPREIVEAAREVMGSIELDPASCHEANATVRARRIFTVEQDGLRQYWEAATAWLNPPYGKSDDDNRSNQAVWISRLIDAHRAGRVEQGCALVNAVPGNNARCCSKERREDDDLHTAPLLAASRTGGLDGLVNAADLRPDEADSLRRMMMLAGFASSAASPSVVYFIRSADSSLIKIGLTRCGVDRRVASFKTGHPGELTVLATMPGDRAAERRLHERFASSRRSGEWFAPDPALMDFIAGLTRGI